MTLPAIVAAIREQKPGVVPEPLQWDDELESWCWYPDKTEDANDELPESVAIALLEAAMWKVLVMQLNNASASLHVYMNDRAAFDSNKLSTIRALCHAIGVRLDNK